MIVTFLITSSAQKSFLVLTDNGINGAKVSITGSKPIEIKLHEIRSIKVEKNYI